MTATADNGQVQLAWLQVDGATGYRVYMASEPGVTANSFEIASIADTTFTHVELDLSLTYYYRVSAENAWAEGPLSAEASAAPRISAPVLLSAWGDDERVTLTWDPLERADSYNVYWAMEAGVTADSNRLSDVRSPFVHKPLVNNTTYYYTVTAVDGPGESSMSNEVSVKTLIDMGTKLVAFDAEAGDRFGRSVALSGDYAIVGAPGQDGGDGDPIVDAGAAHVFHRTSQDTWDSGTELVAPDAQAYEWFGWSVALAGDYAIVGSHGGAAYVFHRTGQNAWDSGTELVAPGAQASGRFGWCVALAGDYALVGADDEDGGAALSNAGAAYVFHRTGENTWDSGAKLVAPDAQAHDCFGSSVALRGDYAIVGAYAKTAGHGDSMAAVGAAYVFHRTGENTWDPGAKLVAPDAQAYDRFGASVALASDYAIVRAPGEDGGAGDPVSNAGAAYVFHRTDENGWDLGTKLVAPDAQRADGFDGSVALSSGHAIIGAATEDGGHGDPLVDAGAAYLFRRTGESTWGSATRVMAPDAQTDDQFGGSVAIDGERAIVGAYGEDGGDSDPVSNAGAAYVFEH